MSKQNARACGLALGEGLPGKREREEIATGLDALGEVVGDFLQGAGHIGQYFAQVVSVAGLGYFPGFGFVYVLV